MSLGKTFWGESREASFILKVRLKKGNSLTLILTICVDIRVTSLEFAIWKKINILYGCYFDDKAKNTKWHKKQ